MISAVVDTNVLLAGAISSNPASSSKEVLNAFFAGQFLLLLSPETFQEFQRVLGEPDIRVKHGWTDEKIVEFCHTLEVAGRMIEPTTTVSAAVTRDITDTKWVALALDADADYLVTQDRRHLLRLKKVGRTKVVRPRAFLEIFK